MFKISHGFSISVIASALFLGACAPVAKYGRDQALIKASRKGEVSKVKTLLNSGADMNAVDSEGWTPYLAASAEGNWEVMKILERGGAKTDPGF